MRPRVLNSRTPEFKKFLAAIRSRRGGDNVGLDSTVAKIIEQVRKRGDRALIEFTAKFDRVKLTASTIRVTSAVAARSNSPRAGLRIFTGARSRNRLSIAIASGCVSGRSCSRYAGLGSMFPAVSARIHRQC